MENQISILENKPLLFRIFSIQERRELHQNLQNNSQKGIRADALTTSIKSNQDRLIKFFIQ